MKTIEVKTSKELSSQNIGQAVKIGTKKGWYIGEELIHTCPSYAFEVPMIIVSEREKMVKYEVHLDETGGALIPHEVRKKNEIERYLSLRRILN